MKRFLILLLLGAFSLQGQDESPWQFNGYLKYLGSFSQLNEDFIDPNLRAGIDLTAFDQQLHNRFDLRYLKGSGPPALAYEIVSSKEQVPSKAYPSREAWIMIPA